MLIMSGGNDLKNWHKKHWERKDQLQQWCNTEEIMWCVQWDHIVLLKQKSTITSLKPHSIRTTYLNIYTIEASFNSNHIPKHLHQCQNNRFKKITPVIISSSKKSLCPPHPSEIHVEGISIFLVRRFTKTLQKNKCTFEWKQKSVTRN